MSVEISRILRKTGLEFYCGFRTKDSVPIQTWTVRRSLVVRANIPTTAHSKELLLYRGPAGIVDSEPCQNGTTHRQVQKRGTLAFSVSSQGN